MQTRHRNIHNLEVIFFQNYQKNTEMYFCGHETTLK